MLVSLVAALTLGTAEAAEDCSLKRVAQFDMVETGTDRPVIEVKFNGKPVKMLVDTGADWSAVNASLTEGLRKVRPPAYGVGAGGGVLHDVAIVPEFALGPVRLPNNLEFLILPESSADGESSVGLIGSNILTMFDVEIDYKGRKVVFYNPDHCPGRVISWPHDNYAKLHFERRRRGGIAIPVTLDGHSMLALLDTGASQSYVQGKVAADLFGLTPESPGVEPAGTTAGADGRTLMAYHHRFNMLTLDELAFPHPLIAFYEGRHEGLDVGVGAGYGGDEPTNLILGTRHLRLMHLYIAYHEHTVYATLAN